jgi:hypothetical protein
LFTDLGGKFKFSAQDSDLEYLFWRSKTPPVSSDLKPPLRKVVFHIISPNHPISHLPSKMAHSL